SSIGRGKSKRPGLPDAASWGSSGPPGYGRPNNLADLSNAPPAASSRVSPSTLYDPGAATAMSIVWPPETSSARCGNGGGTGSSSGASRGAPGGWTADAG